MYYILGINHYIQYVNKQIKIQLFTDFVSYISDIVEQYDITLIAEEFNDDCLELNHVNRSVLQLISEELSIGHIFVDPPQRVRTVLGMSHSWLSDEEVSHLKREIYWLEQTESRQSENILYCIGASHVRAFSQLIENRQRQCVVLNPYWEESAFIKRDGS